MHVSRLETQHSENWIDGHSQFTNEHDDLLSEEFYHALIDFYEENCQQCENEHDQQANWDTMMSMKGDAIQSILDQITEETQAKINGSKKPSWDNQLEKFKKMMQEQKENENNNNNNGNNMKDRAMMKKSPKKSSESTKEILFCGVLKQGQTWEEFVAPKQAKVLFISCFFFFNTHTTYGTCITYIVNIT